MVGHLLGPSDRAAEDCVVTADTIFQAHAYNRSLWNLRVGPRLAGIILGFTIRPGTLD